MSVKFGDKEYALVPDRLKQFREANPRASITSKRVNNEDGSVEFVTYILTDKSDEYSADADGHAKYTAEELKKPKSYEKLETISLGRALAKLGYLNDGQIATTEEMAEFHQYKEDKVEQAIEKINETKTVDELKETYLSLGMMKYPKVVTAKDLQFIKLQKASKA